MAYIHKFVSRKSVEQGKTEFRYLDGLHILDEKGRRVGASWGLTEVTSRLADNDDEHPNWGWRFDWPDTVHFGVSVQPTRDGKDYGASQRTHSYLTLDECYLKKNALIKGTRARYKKKYGRA